MKLSIVTLAGLSLLLAGCSTTGALSTDALSKRWVGKEAGKFFAAYGPPIADTESGSSSTYNWKGGYKTRRTPAQYEGEGKARKLVARARTDYLVCHVKLTVDSNYTITSITRITDKAGVKGGPTWCEEFLDAAG
ncbi:hypothetical protein [Rhizobium alvei]|uniref:Lipoprotein n=1 Tax=Rhizobium alvei TaxID=1132659 RepID=A0ABT8YI42_9HYPH|nr:hypothetical protein [Rhizobium alvei]MDO6962935.1 hypothetical protein [Rhizobium alvei]